MVLKPGLEGGGKVNAPPTMGLADFRKPCLIAITARYKTLKFIYALPLSARKSMKVS